VCCSIRGKEIIRLKVWEAEFGGWKWASEFGWTLSFKLLTNVTSLWNGQNASKNGRFSALCVKNWRLEKYFFKALENVTDRQLCSFVNSEKMFLFFERINSKNLFLTTLERRRRQKAKKGKKFCNLKIRNRILPGATKTISVEVLLQH